MALRYQASQLRGLIAGDQEDRLTPGVEGEQHPYLGAASRQWPQLFHDVVTADLHAASQRPSQRGALVPLRGFLSHAIFLGGG